MKASTKKAVEPKLTVFAALVNVASARLRVPDEAEQTLELEASAGCNTHLDGSQRRIKVGELKIGLILCEVMMPEQDFHRVLQELRRDELLQAVRSRLERQPLRSAPCFSPDFSSAKPLERLGLTRREAEVLLWLAQGKSNSAIAVILGNTVSTVKKHIAKIFTKLGLETRLAAAVRALEVLTGSGP